jgi:predicted permease
MIRRITYRYVTNTIIEEFFVIKKSEYYLNTFVHCFSVIRLRERTPLLIYIWFYTLSDETMDLFSLTLQSVIVLMGIGIIGFWIIRNRIVPENALGLLSPLALEVALPSLIFVNIITYFTPNEFPTWWQLPIYWLFFTAVTAVLTFLFSRFAQKQTRREFACTLFFQNAIFFPVALLIGLFPNDQSYLSYLFIFVLFYAALLFNASPYFFIRTKIKLNLKKIFHPVLIATLFALFLRLTGASVMIPDYIVEIFRVVGAMAVPLIMIVLGGNIYVDYKRKGKFLIGEVMKFVIIKNLLFQLIFIAILLLFRPEYPIALIILLQAAVPPVTALPILTERNGGNRSIVNQFIVASFIFSIVSLPLMIGFFGLYFKP